MQGNGIQKKENTSSIYIQKLTFKVQYVCSRIIVTICLHSQTCCIEKIRVVLIRCLGHVHCMMMLNYSKAQEREFISCGSTKTTRHTNIQSFKQMQYWCELQYPVNHESLNYSQRNPSFKKVWENLISLPRELFLQEPEECVQMQNRHVQTP